MDDRPPAPRLFSLGIPALALVALLLGLRNHQVVGAVLSRGEPAVLEMQGNGRGTDGDIAELARRDSLVAAASAGNRDPFRPRAPAAAESPGRGAGAARPREEPQPAPPPRISSLLYDDVRPSVQLRIGPETSGWLHEGEIFHEWTVMRITPTTVTLASGERTVVLP
ncbi:MAG: hypothetical protein FJY75_13835 [Candidatus Eisenbacteria bacterium]|uniref:Uncharacterized protein n=1 Tax=Eiseniibacteriota bacterium TaxID=2212470 RepID=A0A937XEB1_UNCEI|nr:hypothetical protein [Candidatus Eisenbacteria bacterium]